MWKEQSNEIYKNPLEYIKKCLSMCHVGKFMPYFCTFLYCNLSYTHTPSFFFFWQEEIVCSSYVTALYLKQQNFNRKVYIMGASGIAKELEDVGIAHTGAEVCLILYLSCQSIQYLFDFMKKKKSYWKMVFR